VNAALAGGIGTRGGRCDGRGGHGGGESQGSRESHFEIGVVLELSWALEVLYVEE
jgi:hypothetical protein